MMTRASPSQPQYTDREREREEGGRLDGAAQVLWRVPIGTIVK